MAELAVIILTLNEERHIARAISSVRAIAKQIVVVDSYSTDNTVAIATSCGAEVVQNPFINNAKQFQWALDNVRIAAHWIMKLDADEIVEPDLADEIDQKLPGLDMEIVGINLKRKHIFMDRWVRHGGRYPLLLLRIWRNGVGRVEDRWMDEHVIIEHGRTTTFNGGFADHNLNDLSYFIKKHNAYATREAIETLNQKLKLFPNIPGVTIQNSSLRTALKRSLKTELYNRIPFTLSTPLYFLWRYIFQLGFLDGKSGLIYHFLQGYWYRFLVGSKVLELERAVANCTSTFDIVCALSRFTQLDLQSKPPATAVPETKSPNT